MDHVLPSDQSSEWNTWGRSHSLGHSVRPGCPVSAADRGPESIAIKGPQRTEISFAEPRCPFEHCIEHRYEVPLGVVDHLQNLCGRCFPSDCFVALGSARGKPPLQ